MIKKISLRAVERFEGLTPGSVWKDLRWEDKCMLCAKKLAQELRHDDENYGEDRFVNFARIINFIKLCRRKSSPSYQNYSCSKLYESHKLLKLTSTRACASDRIVFNCCFVISRRSTRDIVSQQHQKPTKLKPFTPKINKAKADNGKNQQS